MSDIIIHKGRYGIALVSFTNPKGWLFLSKHMWASPMRTISIPNELVEEWLADVKKIDKDISVEVK